MQLILAQGDRYCWFGEILLLALTAKAERLKAIAHLAIGGGGSVSVATPP
ncbi:MAG: hypothetical protein AAGA60_02545 [Cyanobacteria bacterium P01_E01_bin.42]